MACVNINSKEFKDAVQRLNINSGELELIAHKFINQSEENLDKFPSDLYILDLLSPSTFEASSKQLEMYFRARHDIPMQFNSVDSYKDALNKLRTYYPAEAVKGYKNANGLYTILVATPKVKGIPMVLDNSMIDSFTRGLLENNPYHTLFGKLITAIGKDNVSIKMQKEAPIGRSGNPSYADYNPATNTITFYIDSILNQKLARKESDAYTRRYLFKTLTHELLHQLTYLTINEEGISAAGKEFTNKINSLYNEVLDYFNGDKNAHYGLFDINEFISEAMTNINFQRDLAKIKSKEGNKQKSLWSKFIDAISNFFKQKLGIDINNTILEDTISSVNSFIDYATEFKEQNDLYNESLDYLNDESLAQSYSELHEALKAFRGDWNRPSYKGFTTGRFENTQGKWRIIIPESFRGTVAEAKEIVKEMLASQGATEEMYSLGKDFDRISENGVAYNTLRVGFKSDKRGLTTTRVKDKIKVPKSKMTPEEMARQDAIDLLLEVRPDLKFQIDNGLIDVDYLINNPDEITTLASAFESPNEVKEEQEVINSNNLNDINNEQRRKQINDARNRVSQETETESRLREAISRVSDEENSSNSDARTSNAERLKNLEQWARKNELWVDNLDTVLEENFGKPFITGGEALVYQVPNDNIIVKAISLDYYNGDIQKGLDRILIHNHLFPDTALTDIGFGIDSDGKFRIIAALPYIIGTAATRQEILDYARERGFFTTDGNTYFADDIQINDLNVLNVIKDTEGNLRVIDNQLEFNPQERLIELEREDPFIQRTRLIQDLLNNLRNSDIITQTEVREIADDIVYWISDFITSLLTNLSAVLDNLAQLGYTVNHLRNLDFSSMTRAEVVKLFGVQQLLKRAKEQFDPMNNEENEYYDDYNVVKLMHLVQNNFEGLMEFAQPTFLSVEKFSIKYNDRGLAEVNDDLSNGIDATDFNNTNSEEEIKELEGSEAEHWMIESRSRDIMEDMGKVLENALVQCFILDSEGNRVKSSRGIDKRINTRQAINSIVRWTQGALNLSDMITKLQEKQELNPWVSQLIERLLDNSGKESDLLSQFWSSFYKPFQLFSTVKYEKGEFKAIPINEHKALSEALRSVKAQYNTGKHPLFTTDGVNTTALKDLNEAFTSITEITNDLNIDYNNQETKEKLARNIAFAANQLGYYTVPEAVISSINKSNVADIKNALSWIIKSLEKNKGNKSFEPFVFKGEGNIEKNVKDFLRPLTEQLEDIAVSSFYENGKMYQSYVTPSYMTKLALKFKLTGDRLQEFILNEFKNYDWFYDKNSGEWLNEWVLLLANNAEARKIFAHKVLLSFNKKNYMKDMKDVEYALSLMTEYFSEAENETQALVPAWFRIPMISNKPSSEFIRFYSHRGIAYKETIARGLKNVFNLEMRRIQTVNMRNRSKGDSDFIKNLDTNGKKFNFLPFFNKYLEEGYKNEAHPEFGRLLRSKIKGEKLEVGGEDKLFQEAIKIIKEEMELKAETTVNNWKELGILEAAKKIRGIGKTPKEIEDNLKNFVWNDFYAAINIMELTVTDIAYYKDAEDLLKRLAQIHSPGIRPNVDAVDYEGRKVSDGLTRTFYLKDFDGVLSNIIDNVGIVFDKKIQDALDRGNKTGANGLRILKDNLVGKDGQFRQINITDAQGYACPTSYRKKAILFGKWSKEREKLFNKIESGKWNYSDVKEAFQPLKPFVYSQILKSVNAEGAPMQNFKMGVQNKNSEYLLILADAILKGENTGRPNLLRAIYEVMEESHYDPGHYGDINHYRTDGIDTVLFESTVKTGLMGVMDINLFASLKPFENLVDGEARAKNMLQTCIYKADYRPTKLEVNPRTNELEETQSNVTVSRREYNDTFVHSIPLEDYSIQLETPEHFKNHELAHGSLGRYIIPSELAEFDAFGNEILYSIKSTITENGETRAEIDEEGNTVTKLVSAKEFKERYELNIAENIEDSINQLREELHLTGSVKEKNIAISKLLQREILNSPRYGVDLYLACSVDENGAFRIPLGDPIQSKRIELLLNSVIKNRVNKLKIAGGPVVQVSNFGTSRELNIRFKDKNGGLLMTKEEWEKSTLPSKEATFKDYIKKNQGGIAHFEVFASIYNPDLLKFADKDGNIDIDTLELINPDLLKMVGYRIPTEAKYSMAPLKIVGFLPREAGAAIMLPNDITLLTGSDFDIDKEYLMRKEFDIAFRYDPKREITENMSEVEKDWIQHNKKDLRKVLSEAINLTATLNKEDMKRVDDLLWAINKALERKHKENVDRITKRNELLVEKESNIKFSNNEEKNTEIWDKRDTKLEKSLNKALEKEDKRYKEEKEKQREKAIDRAKKAKVLNRVEQFLNGEVLQPAKLDDPLTRALRKAYLDYTVRVIEPTSGRSFRNNEIIDMTYEVLTHEQSAAEMLNPGGFEPLKRMGYMVAAFKDTNNNYTWEQLQKMSVSELKDLCQVDKNLMDIGTHIQFYKQNSAAGSLIGIFAVERVAHAVIENEGYQMDIFKACKRESPFKVMGINFGENNGTQEIDVRQNSTGESVGKVLGSLVASAADAVKDPVLNLMNINSETANVLNTLIRLGMPFDDAALFLSTAAISNILSTHSKEGLSKFKSIATVINERIKLIEDSQGIKQDSPIHNEELTKEEVLNSIKAEDMTLDAEYKILKALQNFRSMAEAMRLPTFATRFNSISNAVGPLAIDNLITDYKTRKLNEDSCILDAEGEEVSTVSIMLRHPILEKFNDTLSLANTLLKGTTANSQGFYDLVYSLQDNPLLDTIMRDRKILNNLSDFYLSYLLILNNVIDENDLSYYITKFPEEFLNNDYKTKYKDNLLIQSIRFGNDKSDRLTLLVELTGVDTADKEKIGDGWSDLYKKDLDLAMKLFRYCFFRGGIGFNPKSFMALLPLLIKEKIPGYLDTYRLLPEVIPEYVIDQFVRNNWDNNKLVPIKEDLLFENLLGKLVKVTAKTDDLLKELAKSSYFKTRVEEDGVLVDKLFKLVDTIELPKRPPITIFKEIEALGSNKDYIEMSKDDITKATNTTTEVIEDTIEPGVLETEVNTNETTIPEAEEAPVVSEEEELDNNLNYYEDLAMKAWMNVGRTAQQALDEINTFRNRPEREKGQMKRSLKNFFRTQFEKMNMLFDEETVEKVFESIC